MYSEIKRVKGYNKIILILIAIALVVLMGVVTLFIYSLLEGVVSLLTVVSATSMFMVCLPLSLLLYRSSKDRTSKNLFLGLFTWFVLLSLSAIMWYIIPFTIQVPWMIFAAKIIMVISYVPLQVILLIVYMHERRRIEPNAMTFILFANGISALFVLYFVVYGLGSFQADKFDSIIYAISVLGDILFLTIGSVLLLNHLSDKLRYVFSILFVNMILSLIGDSLNMFGYLGLYDTAGYAQPIYDIMLLITSAALLAYSLSNIKSITVEEMNQKLNEERLLTNDLVMQSPDPICICGPNGNLINANMPFLKLFGIDGALSANTFNIFDHISRFDVNITEKTDRLRRGETVMIDGAKMSPLQGKEIYLHLKAFPAFTPDGTISRYIIFLEDITVRKRAEEEMRATRMQAELYLDLMGHDIRNLNQISMGYLELALDMLNLDEQGRQLISRSLEAMKSSSKLIDNVKKIQRAEKGDVEFKEMNVGDLIEELIPQYANISGRDVRIHFIVECDCLVLANDLLSDVFANLIGNSIKHSKGPVEVNILVSRLIVGNVRYCRVFIEDDGPGVQDAQKVRIFDRFKQGDTVVKGIGLGLYLVRTLVDDFGGRVWVEDRVLGDHTKGSRFVVMLPEVDHIDRATSSQYSQDDNTRA